MFARSLPLHGLFLSVVLGVLGETVPEPDPVFDTIDLNATYIGMRKIFSRMQLSPKEMAVLIGGGHSSGAGTLEGGTYHGNWVEPMTLMGPAYFQLLTGHKQWCAVKSSDNGNAHFVAKGAADYIAETEYSPLAKHLGEIPCVETGPGRAIFDDLPTVPVEEMIYQPGVWHKPSGATAMLPVDFALQYSNETYPHVEEWAFNERLFFKDFAAAWTKMTELGQELRCSTVNGPPDFNYSDECAARFGDEASYRATWGQIRSELKTMFDALPLRCKSIRPTAVLDGDSHGSVCPLSIFRLGFHISATYDPEASGNVGGSSFANFLGPCAFYDGCAGCLHDTQLALQSVQQRYEHLNVSLADVTMYAAGLAAAYQAEFRLNQMPFHPGRVDAKMDSSVCNVLGARLPSPSYQFGSNLEVNDHMKIGDMLSGDMLAPSQPDSSELPSHHVIV